MPVTLPHPELGAAWRAARGRPAVVHLDSAACSRPSNAVLEAVAAHARHEGEIGGYAAEFAAEPVLAAGRAGLAGLLGLAPDDIAFVESGTAATDTVLRFWPGLTAGSRVAVAPSEWGPTVAWLVDRGVEVIDVPTAGSGCIDPAELAEFLDSDRPPMLVLLTQLASHRGLVQPAAAVGAVCRDAGVALVVDVSQSLGQLPTHDIGADAYIGTGRKWLAGPRGVGFLGINAARRARLTLSAPVLGAQWLPGDMPGAQRLSSREAHIAGRVGLAVAVGEHLAAGPTAIHARLTALGVAAAEVLDGVGGWRVAPDQGPSSLVSLIAPPGVDALPVRGQLLANHAILTTYAGLERAPRDGGTPMLRVSPHVDAEVSDLHALAQALDALAR